jgi:hypothetical protein
MGLGLYITASIQPEGFLFKRMPTRQELLDRLQTAIPAAIADKRLCELLWMAVEDETLLVGLHPAAAPVRFAFADETLCCEARTSGAGPGYHAFLVELLHTLGQKCRLRWQWEGAGIGDETGFALHKDFARLQTAMLDELKALCASLVEKDGDGWKVGLAMDYPVPAEDVPFAMTALGPRTREWVATTATADGAALQAAGAAFFPWWGPAADAAFWRSTALALCWVDLPWHPPIDEEEQGLYQLALTCLEIAAESGAPALPDQLVPELRKMAAASADAPPVPDAAGIGYRRRPLAFALPGLWKITVPGYYYAHIEAQREEYVFAYGAREVTALTLTVASRSENAAFEERLLQNMKALSGEAELRKFQRGTLIGRAALGRDADGWALLGYVAASNNMAVVNILFPTEDEQEWALGVWQSLRHPEGS